MSKRNGGVLNNWFKQAYSKRPMSMRVSTISDDEYDFFLCGRISGDDKWEEGESLHTSLVVSMSDTKVETLNTVYQLGTPHPNADKLWNDSIQRLVPYEKLDIPYFWIREEYLTSVPVTFQRLDRKQPNISLEDAPRSACYRHIDHPSFTDLREYLEHNGYIEIEDGWSNGDKCLKPFYLNDKLFRVDDKFPCASAMKIHLEFKEEDDEILDELKRDMGEK